MTGTPLVIGPHEVEKFTMLKDYAALPGNVVDMPALLAKLKTAAGKREHMEQMNNQTVRLPFGYLVTYSVEAGHPIGTCRHMSMSSPAKGRVPSPEAVWMVAEYFGFKGGIEACNVWEEKLQRGHDREIAINIVQPLHAS